MINITENMGNIQIKFGCIYLVLFLIILGNKCSCERYDVHKAMRAVNHTHQRTYSAAILPEEKPLYSIIFVFVTFGLAVFVRCIWSKFRIKPPYVIVLFGVGCLIGWLSFLYEDVHIYVKGICNMSPKYLLMIFLPVIIFRAAYGIDAHLFVKCIKQILLFSTVGCIISLSLMAVVMKFLYFSKWSWEVAIMFGAITSTCYAEYTVSLLRDLGQSKYLSIIIEGEGLIADASAIVIFNIVFGYITGYITEGVQIFAVCMAFLAGSPLVGFLFGKLTVFFLTWASSDPIACATITLVSTYLTYYIAEQLFGLSGVLCIVMLGMVISIERLSIRTEMDNFLEKFWELLAFYASSLIFMIVGVLVFEIISGKISFQDTMMSFVVYAICFICRIVMYTCMNVALKWCKYNLTWRHATVAMWGNLCGPVSLCLALVVHKSEGLEEEGPQFLIYTAVLVLLTHVIQGCTLYSVMRLLGLHEISEARIANMNSAMKYIYITRERAINMVKMDRHLADANWLRVAEGTQVKHPYKVEMKDLKDEVDVFLGIRFAFCPDCEKEVLAEPTKKEFKEMQREAYLRILKAKKVSYRHQFEQGMLTKEGIHILVTAVDIASHRKVPIMEVDDLKVFRTRRKITLRIRKYLIKMLWRVHNVQPPKRRFNLQCYKIVMNRWFEYCLCGIILLQVIPISLEIYYSPEPHSDMFLALMITHHIFYLIFLAEFIMKIAAFGWKMYFKDPFNALDFIILVISTVCLFFYYQEFYQFLFSYDSKFQTIFIPFVITFRILRFMRLIRILRISLPQSIIFIDTLLDYHIMLNYDVGKGFVAGEEDILKILPHIIDNKKIYREIRHRVERDRLTVSKDLGLIQKDFPEIAITVKTRQSIRVVLNKIEDAVTELKDRGILDEFEYSKCKHMINICLKYLRTHFKKVEPCPPHILLKEISWVSGDSKIEEFLFENCQPINFNYDDVIISHSTLPEALYIILYGVVKLIYEPTRECVWDLQNFGALPNVDYFTTLNFEERQEEYIVGGNVIGEMGILTGRPYDVTVQCETSVQAFKVSMSDMLKAMELNPDPSVGLKARMWKSVAIRIADVILSNTPHYQSWPEEEIKYHLERAFVPTLSQEATFSINDLIEDVILIEGQVMDANSRNIYYAPCCIPRNVQKLYFPGCNMMRVPTHIETKLLIVPVKHYNEVGVHGDGQNIHISSSFSIRCLQHSAKSITEKQHLKSVLIQPGNRELRSVTFPRQSSKMSTKKSVDFSESNEITQYVVYPNQESSSSSEYEPSNEAMPTKDESMTTLLKSRFDLQRNSTITAAGSKGNITLVDDSDVRIKKEKDTKKLKVKNMNMKKRNASESAGKDRSSQHKPSALKHFDKETNASDERSEETHSVQEQRENDRETGNQVKLSDIIEREEDDKDTHEKGHK